MGFWTSARTLLAASVITAAVVAGSVAAAAPAAGGAPGPFAAELARESARLEARFGRPEAIAPLTAILALDDNVPAAAVEGVLRRAAAPGADPLVAAQAAFQLARLLDNRGDEAGATALRGPLGLISRYWVVGPFGEGRSSFGQAFPPEKETGAPDPERRYPGKSREVGWRRGDQAVRDGVLFLDGLMRPDSQAAAYALVFTRSDRDRTAALRLGAPGPIKVWVNGKMVHARDAVHAPGLDQDAAGVRLRKGWNRILIKTVVTDGPWRLYARLTDLAGKPLTGHDPGAALPTPDEMRAVPAASVGPAIPVRTLEAALRRRAQAGGAGGSEAWLDLGRYLAWAEPGDREERGAATALEASIARRPSVAGLLLLGDVARDDDERRRALERGLLLAETPEGERGAPEAASAAGLLHARLGEVARAQRRDAVALQHWRLALKEDPGCWPASLALADEEQSAGLPLVALARAEALPEAVRAVPRVRRELARLLEAAGRERESDRLLSALGDERRRDIELLHQLAARARARGERREAVERLAVAAALRPDLPSLAIELARTLEGTGEKVRALAVMTDLADRLADDPGTVAHLGKLLHRLGRRDEALARLRAAIALRPQDPELRRYTEHLAADTGGGDAAGEDLARRFAADARGLLNVEPSKGSTPPAMGSVEQSSPARGLLNVEPSKGSTPPAMGSVEQSSPAPTRSNPETQAPKTATTPPAAQVGDAVVLLDRRVVRVHRNGLSQTFAQRVVRIVSEHGAEENKEFYVRYTPGSEEVEIRQARIYRRGPRGDYDVLEATDRDDEDLSEPWYGLYYDNRAEVVRFEGLRAGDVMEVQYLVDDVSNENQMSDYFGNLEFIAESIPKRRWDYTLIAPASRVMHTNTPRVPGLVRQVSDEGGDRVYRFSATDVPKVDSEPAMPGLAEIAPYLHVSTYGTWAEVGAWYWRLVEEQLTSDDELRRAARSAVTRGMTEEERVRAIHDLVVTGTRYVGLEFGIHGYKPYKVTQVLARRFGDCKDKASLLVALLREVGVSADLVLVRTRRGGRIDSEPASLAVFDHAIVYVPKLDVYLDGTAEFAGVSELPAQDQGVMVLRVGPAGAVLAETPVLPSDQNRVQRRWQVDLAATGDAHVVEDLTIRGQAAPDWREHYQTPGERAERYGKVWTARYPGARLTSIDMPEIDDRDAPVTVHAVADLPRFGQTVGSGVGPAAAGGEGARALSLPVTVREADFARTYARLSGRRHELVIAYPWQHDEELRYRIPKGWRLDGGPVVRELAGPFGRFHLEVKAEADGTVRVRSFLDVTRYRIAAEDYGRFRAFLGEIDGALAERVVIATGIAEAAP